MGSEVVTTLPDQEKMEEKQCFGKVLLCSDVVTTRPDKGKIKEKHCFDKVLLGSEVVTTSHKEKTMPWQGFTGQRRGHNPSNQKENKGKTML